MSTKNRDSNIELLRIVIMFLILLLHANFLTFKRPTDYSLMSFSRCFAQAFTLTPVNIFVLITGFFGSSFSIRKSLSLIYQVIFCVIPISLILVFCGIIDFDYHYFVIHKYWFINAYLVLLVFTPFLNAAVEKLSQKDFKNSLILLYLALFVCSRVGLTGVEVSGGYSIIWFLFLYLLGRYVKLYPPSLSKKQLIWITLISCLCNSIVIFTLNMGDYVFPFIVIQSVSTLLLFSKIKFSNSFINKVGISTTMVYLINLHPALWDFEKNQFISFYQHFSIPVFLLCTLLFCAAIFVFAILYDKLRLFTWNMLDSLFKNKSKITSK